VHGVNTRSTHREVFVRATSPTHRSGANTIISIHDPRRCKLDRPRGKQ
jgi:hypothetical protein